MVRMAGKLFDDQITKNNSGSKAASLRTYLALQEVGWGRGLTPKILLIYRIKEVVGISGFRRFVQGLHHGNLAGQSDRSWIRSSYNSEHMSSLMGISEAIVWVSGCNSLQAQSGPWAQLGNTRILVYSGKVEQRMLTLIILITLSFTSVWLQDLS